MNQSILTISTYNRDKYPHKKTWRKSTSPRLKSNRRLFHSKLNSITQSIIKKFSKRPYDSFNLSNNSGSDFRAFPPFESTAVCGRPHNCHYGDRHYGRVVIVAIVIVGESLQGRVWHPPDEDGTISFGRRRLRLSNGTVFRAFEGRFLYGSGVFLRLWMLFVAWFRNIFRMLLNIFKIAFICICILEVLYYKYTQSSF